jgi:hypothetical protein
MYLPKASVSRIPNITIPPRKSAKYPKTAALKAYLTTTLLLISGKVVFSLPGALKQ